MKIILEHVHLVSYLQYKIEENTEKSNKFDKIKKYAFAICINKFILKKIYI